MDEVVLRVEMHTLNGTTLVTVVGEVDAASLLTLQAPLDELSLERHILVDTSGVRFMDSSGLKVILAQRMRMVESGGSIYIRNPSPCVQRLIEVTGLDDVLYEPQVAASPETSEVEAAIVAGGQIVGTSPAGEPLVEGPNSK
jgi:anti-anti-sigma factor